MVSRFQPLLDAGISVLSHSPLPAGYASNNMLSHLGGKEIDGAAATWRTDEGRETEDTTLAYMNTRRAGRAAGNVFVVRLDCVPFLVQYSVRGLVGAKGKINHRSPRGQL
ncbi:hypothetical protein KC345_g224 [Hortaea werneckii]|nr:hypothetical protein KC345_g224 [Hortaea werneckii]